MKQILGIILIMIVFHSCKNSEKNTIENSEKISNKKIINGNYELSCPSESIIKTLVLFGGYPEIAKDVKREFKIDKIAKERGIAIVYMNYNEKLWLEDNEKQQLAEDLQNIFIENNLPKNEVYLGGFSSGGNVALLISSFLTANSDFNLNPKGVFIVDSPIDLLALHNSSIKNIDQNFSESAIQESKWIIKTLEKNLGAPEHNLSNYEKYSAFTSETNYISNLKSLKNTKIRLYTEPDTLWWKVNRKADYDQMNAFYIKQLSERLISSGFNQVQYIPTENKGYRSNGNRHPHSWSIVNKEELIDWMME